MHFFWLPFSIEIRTLSLIIYLKCADLLVVTGIVVLSIILSDGYESNILKPEKKK